MGSDEDKVNFIRGRKINSSAAEEGPSPDASLLCSTHRTLLEGPHESDFKVWEHFLFRPVVSKLIVQVRSGKRNNSGPIKKIKKIKSAITTSTTVLACSFTVLLPEMRRGSFYSFPLGQWLFCSFSLFYSMSPAFAVPQAPPQRQPLFRTQPWDSYPAPAGGGPEEEAGLASVWPGRPF